MNLSRPGRFLALVLWFGYSAAAAPAQAPQPPPALPQPLPLFPPDNWWNVNVSAAPVDNTATASFLAFVPGTTGLHPDFGGDVGYGDPNAVYGMIYAVVPGGTPLEQPVFGYGDQSDTGAPGRPPGYPIPVAARTEGKWIEGGTPGGCDPFGDDHMLLVDTDNRLLYEIYNACWSTDHWDAGSGAIYSLDGNNRRPEGWTSADASGIEILPGLVRYDEAFGSAPIQHAFRFTIGNTKASHVFPAVHTACNSPCPTLNSVPMGARLRLKPSVNPTIPGGATASEIAAVGRIFQAMKTYGLLLTDNGSNMYITGAYDTRWNNDVLNPAFSSVKASDFEVITLGWKPSTAPPLASAKFCFHTLAPCRLLDTRNPNGSFGGPALFPGYPGQPGWQRIVVAPNGACGVSASAESLAVNITVPNAAATASLSLYPGDLLPPGPVALAQPIATIPFAFGQTRANNAVVTLAASGSGAFAIQNNAAVAVHAVVDVFGYFASDCPP